MQYERLKQMVYFMRQKEIIYQIIQLRSLFITCDLSQNMQMI